MQQHRLEVVGMMKRLMLLVALVTMAGLCVIPAGAVGPPPGAGPPNGLPAAAQSAIAAAQARVDQAAGQNLVLHEVRTDHHADGFTTDLQVALPPGETSWMPGDPGPLPYFVQTTGEGASDWQSSVVSPNQLHSFTVTGPPPTASTSSTRSKANVRLASLHRIGPGPDRLAGTFGAFWVYKCIGQPNAPVVHYGAFGYIGVITVNDFIDCNSDNVTYEDKIYLYYFEIPIAANIEVGVLGPNSQTLYGFIHSNETSLICRNTAGVPYWGQQKLGVNWTEGLGGPIVASDNNYPNGWMSAVTNVGNCSP